MSYHVYRTDGFVLGSTDTRESAKFLRIFTREIGLVFASAQGVRRLESKLRYSLQDYSYTHLELVRGKEVWRVVNARSDGKLELATSDQEVFQLQAKIFFLLERLVHGEEKNEALFDDLMSAFSFLEMQALSPEETKCAEAVLVARVLRHLGYWGETTHLDTFLDSPWEMGLMTNILPKRKELVSEINASLRHTQL